jgi:probable H4MPT-linked C1 transfer pathway protein
MADYFGWDIGGVHLKLSRLTCGEATAAILTRIVPFEIWRDPESLARRLRALFEDAMAGPGTGTRGRAGPPPMAAHGVTMTAELSDVFPTRAEGVRSILRACASALPAPPRVLDLRGQLLSLREAMERPLDVAAANWAATARLVGRVRRDALLIDVGSTTTDIIPIRGGEPCPAGRTDTDRLLSGELVYSGILRTPPSSLADAVPLRGGWCRVSPEHFTIMGDVHLILGSIAEHDYTAPTPDGRGRSREEAMARLARLVCAEVAEIGPPAIEAIALHLKERQVDQLARAIVQVLSRGSGAAPAMAVSAGAGAFLAEAAARRAGLEAARLARLLPDVAGRDWDRSAPGAALALLLAQEDGALRFGTTLLAID